MPPLATVEGAFALDGFGVAQGGHYSGAPERHRVVLTAATTSSPPVGVGALLERTLLADDRAVRLGAIQTLDYR